MSETRKRHSALGRQYLKLVKLQKGSEVRIDLNEGGEYTVVSLIHSYEQPDNLEFGCFWHPRTKNIVFQYENFEILEKEIERLKITSN